MKASDWKIHFKEIHEAKMRQLHEKLNDGTTQLKIGDQVLKISPDGTVEVTSPKFSIFKVNTTRLELYINNRINRMRKDFHLLKPP